MKGRQRLIFRTVLILIIAGVAYWKRSDLREGGGESTGAPSSVLPTSITISEDETATFSPKPSGTSPKPPTESKVGGYTRLSGARLVDHRNNDGDSFFVRAGDREFELRLYFVDAPEKYLSDRYENQRERVADQARDFGGLTIEETVELGQEAKAHTLDLLEGQSFDIYTKWERVYDGERFYGFVKLPGGEFYLSEHLVASGLARIHTKGEALPDGRSWQEYKNHLLGIEKKARAAGMGAWGK